MAKLFGKADPTLTRMAYAAAAARAPGDYSKYYQSTVDSYKGLLGSIEKIAIQYEARNKAATEELDTAIGIFDDPLSAQIVDADFDDMQAEVNAQRNAWKANKGFKKDPEGLQAWNRKNQQILGRYDQDGSTLSTIASGVKGKLYDTKGMKIEDKEFSTNIANYHANLDKQSGIYNKKTNDYITNNPNATAEEIWNNLGSDVKEGTLVKYKDAVTGEYTYISKVKNKAGDEVVKNSKSSDLLKLFEGYKKADDALISLRSVAENHRKIAVQTSKEYTGFSGSNKNAMIDVIDDALEKNPNALSYLSDKKIAGEEFTFKQALTQGKIPLSNDIIEALGATKSDGDGVLEESDFATPENYQAVVDAILDGKATGVDTKKLFVDHLDSAIGKDHKQYKKLPPKGEDPMWKQQGFKNIGEYEEYLKNKGKKGDEDGESNFGLDLKKNYFTFNIPDVGASYINGKTIVDAVETFKKVQEKGSGIFTGYNDVPYKLTDGKWFAFNETTQKFDQAYNAESIFSDLRWNNNPQIVEYLAEKITKENKDVKSVPNPNMIKELNDLKVKKNRSQFFIDGVTYTSYDEAVKAIKDKYK